MSDPFAPIERLSAIQIVTQRLKKAILEGEIPKGSKLPSERALAVQMRVSRPVIREAVVTLASYGLITCKQGEGNFVVDRFSENVLGFMGFSNTLTADNYDYFFDCRLLFECGMVKEIIAHATPKDIRLLNAINNSFLKELTEEGYVQAEVLFHRTFLELSRNPLAVELYTLVLKFMQISASFLLSQQPIREQAYETHTAIIQAVSEHDCESCEGAVKNHLEVSRNNLRRYFDNLGDKKK